ncbi:MAG: hypothetical protein P1U83_09425 [Roseovarius sp.]|nr:hypothetical protein [Roseovarius sp.]
MYTKFKTLLVLISFSGLAACGDTALEQAVIGAGAGAGTAAVLDGNLLTGAAVGAAGNLIYCQTKKGKNC